ncbi:MAG: EAL domain-containing protein [Candidatus Devosia phytovorans]|uniref:EAL domain-containing protein n=1 Tax=Candidatus Devosia phytovorans TaxID=3121372 RepID=A0AAJ5VU74_9HYPH|nr:EAL domain-containing protein [Devosia sp.]WEK04916.1 MAG: EAL domain-containing protein [Devosia sp.]
MRLPTRQMNLHTGEELLSRAEPSHLTLSRRMSTIYSTATTGLAVLSLFWLGVLLAMKWWELAFIEGVLALACLFTWLLVRAQRLSLAMIVSQLTFYVVILIICLKYDIPDAAAPRVTHLFLLSAALVGYINYIREPSRLQLVMIGVNLVTFVVFASTSLALPGMVPLPDQVRIPGSWLNTIFAVTILVGSVYAMQAELARKSALVRELQAAVLGNQFELFYQPQVDCDGRTIGAEALLRWMHPKRGLVPPDEFISVAEQNGLMKLIGSWVIEQACRTLGQWRSDPDRQDLRLAINVSADHFLDPGFEQFVVAAAARHAIDPTRLKLELTESIMVAKIEPAIAKMTALRLAGIGTALDDFGTGYSSLGYLQRLPLEQLKIDRSFVRDVLDNQRSAALARSVIQIGNDLGLAVLAEGVETQEQFDFLRNNGCTQFQGYLFGRPVPLDQFGIA